MKEVFKHVKKPTTNSPFAIVRQDDDERLEPKSETISLSTSFVGKVEIEPIAWEKLADRADLYCKFRELIRQNHRHSLNEKHYTERIVREELEELGCPEEQIVTILGCEDWWWIQTIIKCPNCDYLKRIHAKTALTQQVYCTKCEQLTYLENWV